MLKRFLNYYKPHKFLFSLDMSVAFLSAILSVLYPFLTRILLKDHIPDKNIAGITDIIFIMIAIILLKTIFTYIRMKWGHILGVRMEYNMRSDIFEHLQKLSFTYYDNVKTGHIMSRISNDLNTIAEVAHHAPEDFIISIFVIIGAFIAMFSFNVQLAIAALIPLPALLIWGMTYGRKMKGGFKLVRKKIADINSSVENSVQGIREVKSYSNEELEIRKFQDVNFHFRQAKEKMYGIMATFYSGMNFLADFYYLIVISYGAYLIFHGKLDVVDLLAFTLYINFMLNPINRLINFTEQFQQGAASFERFIEIMDIEPDIKDKKGAVNLDKVVGNITISDLSFKYDKSQEWILQNINLKIPANKTIALVGESGAGKSSLVSLIPRFYEPQKGSIKIDDVDIMELSQNSLRKNIGIVQQNVFLFDTSIKENICYGKPDTTDEEMIEAARNANILNFILSLPDQFDTLVGERGVKLSGGQKQRISIARVFLKNPPILIFDEATSSLDTESEFYIQKALVKLSRNRTTIIIAHRLSTVIIADFLFVLKDGKIVESGDHQKLISEKGYYYTLYTKNLI
ncbi:MAG: thiamine ABC transporter permease [Candidatus Cloacimonas sp. SDB]|nr:MAG: thiamine ABC transporter permease [Candidatus Cloacimonas sp. SDB]